MKNKIVLSLFFLIAFTIINTCDHIKDELRENDTEIAHALKHNDYKKETELRAKQTKIQHRQTFCQHMINDYNTINTLTENNDNKKAKLLTYTTLSNFVYIHLNEFPDNAKLLKNRLKIYAHGMYDDYDGYYDEHRKKNIINENLAKIEKTIKIDNLPIVPEEELTSIESPETIYMAIQNLYDENSYSKNYLEKRTILDRLALGLEKNCTINCKNKGINTSECKAMRQRLDELFTMNPVQKATMNTNTIYYHTSSNQQNNLLPQVLHIIITIPQASETIQPSEENLLQKEATSTQEWQEYEKYKKIKEKDYTLFFEEECKNSSCDQSNACKLLNECKECKKLLDEQFTQMERNAHNTPQAQKFEQFKQQQRI